MSAFDSNKTDFNWEIVFQATPLPMFIVDDEVRVEECNVAAVEFLKKSRSEVLGCQAGDLLNCIYSQRNGCGASSECQKCVIRNCVEVAINGQISHQVSAKLEQLHENKKVIFQLLVTATPFKIDQDRQLVLLMLENITEVLKLRELLPVCVHCKKIRDDSEYWHEVDVYFSTHLEIDFSHGLCPDCLTRCLGEIEQHDSSPNLL